MTIEALGHRITIRPDVVKDSELTKAKELASKIDGFVFSKSAEDDLESQITREQAGVDQGIVLSIGKTAFKDFGGEAWCRKGDYVAYARHAGKFVQDPDTGENVLVLNDEDILCRIKKKVAKDD